MFLWHKKSFADHYVDCWPHTWQLYVSSKYGTHNVVSWRSKLYYVTKKKLLTWIHWTKFNKLNMRPLASCSTLFRWVFSDNLPARNSYRCIVSLMTIGTVSHVLCVEVYCDLWFTRTYPQMRNKYLYKYYNTNIDSEPMQRSDSSIACVCAVLGDYTIHCNRANAL